MIFQVSRGGKLIGEFTETMMSHKLYSGELRPDDLYRGDGMPDWRTMSRYSGIAQAASPVPAMRKQSSGTANNSGVPLVIDLPAALGFCGSLILLLGVFAPAVSMPLLGSTNYLQNGHGAGAILIVTALASAFLSARRRFNGLWVAGGATMICLIASFIYFTYEIRKFKAPSGRNADRMFADLTSAAADAIQLEWGVVVLFIGGIVLLVAAAVGTGKLRIVR